MLRLSGLTISNSYTVFMNQSTEFNQHQNVYSQKDKMFTLDPFIKITLKSFHIQVNPFRKGQNQTLLSHITCCRKAHSFINRLLPA